MTNEAKWPTQAEIFNAFERAAKSKGNPLAGAQAVADLCLDCANVPYKLDQRAAWIDGLEAALSLTRKEMGDGFKAERAIEAKIKDVRESMAHLRPAERGSPTLEFLLAQLDQPDSTHVWSREDVQRARAELKALQSQPVPTSEDLLLRAQLDSSTGVSSPPGHVHPTQDAQNGAAVGAVRAPVDTPRHPLEGGFDHPEDRCERCGGKNIVWFAPNELWNKYAGPHGILCPLCFAKLAEEATPAAWKLVPEFYDDTPATPSSFGERLTKLAEMEAKATKGPWRVSDDEPSDIVIWAPHPNATLTSTSPGALVRVDDVLVAQELTQADADFLVALRNSWPAIRAALGLSGEGDHTRCRYMASACEQVRGELKAVYAKRAEPGEREAEAADRRIRAAFIECAEIAERHKARFEESMVGVSEGTQRSFWNGHANAAHELAAHFRSLAHNHGAPPHPPFVSASGETKGEVTETSEENDPNSAEASGIVCPRCGQKRKSFVAPHKMCTQCWFALPAPQPAPAHERDTHGDPCDNEDCQRCYHVGALAASVAPPAPAAGEDEVERVARELPNLEDAYSRGAGWVASPGVTYDDHLRALQFVARYALSLRPSASNATMEECEAAYLDAHFKAPKGRLDSNEQSHRAGIAAVRSLFVASNASGGNVTC